jgi:hypothetical protein
MRFHLGLGTVLALSACRPIGDPFDDYYGDGNNVDITSLDVTSESGNLGGGTVAIEGSGFGDDPALVTVQFGSQNATVVEASDESLTVIVPKGPIEGGPVDVAIGTEGGFARLDDGYTYEVSELTENETGYVVVVNDWFSCYAGGHIDPQLPAFCGANGGWVGVAGTMGQARFLTDKFPNVHTVQVGIWTGSDVSPGEWKVQLPGDTFFPQEIDRLGRNVGPVAIRNPLLLGDDYCIDTANLASFNYPGGTVAGTDPKTGEIEYYDAISVSADITSLVEGPNTCDAPDARVYDLGTLEFCEIPYNAEENNEHEYQADWPIDRPFFVSSVDGDEFDATGPVPVLVDIPQEGLSDVAITLPEYAAFRGDLGFIDAPTPYWTLIGLESCFDGDGDGSATLDEDALTLSWIPSSVQPEDVVGGPVVGMETFIQVSLTELRIGWLGGESFPVRASIRVPDDNLFDAGTGRSSVSIPNWVLYQFPTADGNYGFTEPTGGPGDVGTTDWGAASQNVGVFEIEAHRVTEYALQTSDGNEVIVAYATGDFGLYNWTNPIDAGECGDCLDTDGDGWVDDDDPDCEEDAEAEDGSAAGRYSCNDGLDNDDDGDIDVADEDCGDGFDAESNCNDNEDNDDDGFTDEDDGECATPGLGQELGQDLPWWECSNGLDDDKDGWTDLDDPACTSGAAPEDDGFLKEFVCNNGIDDDGHGDIDASDPMCWKYGADSSTEVPAYAEGGACDDATDNDGDGYVDGNDPGCEFAPFATEGETSDDPEDHPTTKQCYDGIDNDGDGFMDAQDPACLDDKGVPDGHLDDEASDAF